jgi:endoglucanase
MKRCLGTLLVFGLCAAGHPASAEAPAAPSTPAHWWQESADWRLHVMPKANARTLPRISVKGNRFVDQAGEPLMLRGVSIADPDKLASQGRWNRDLFVAVKDFGANVVRLPVHPIAWRERGPDSYLGQLDQAVDWCTELGMYVIIDWHSIGNLQSGMFQASMYDTSVPETLAFWRTIAGHFRGHNTTAFYELFNEPAHIHGLLGEMTWPQWKKLNERMIGVIRFWDKEVIPLVAGFDWAYDLTAVRHESVQAEGIGYAVHPYEHHRTAPWEPKWEEDFGFVADKYPMLATELGFDVKKGDTVDESHYGEHVTRYLEQHGMGWVAWCFDPEWGPRLLTSFDHFQLTQSGEFFERALHREPVPVERRPEPSW